MKKISFILNHHEAIVSEEEWNMAQEIRKSRYGKNTSIIEGTREKQSRKFAVTLVPRDQF